MQRQAYVKLSSYTVYQNVFIDTDSYWFDGAAHTACHREDFCTPRVYPVLSSMGCWIKEILAC